MLATLSLLRVKGGRICIIHRMTGNKGGVLGCIVFVLVKITNNELAMRRRRRRDDDDDDELVARILTRLL